MTRNLMILGCAMLLAMGLSFSSFAGSITDGDSDGVPDQYDNCSAVANGPLLGGCAAQEDTDLDGYGNSCDADWDNDGGIIGGTDFLAFSAAFGATPVDVNWDAIVDSDCDAVIGGTDFLLFSAQFAGSVGPSGLACADPSIGAPSCVAQ